MYYYFVMLNVRCEDGRRCYGNHENYKYLFWSDCYKISHEWALACADVHLGFDIFKMATVPMVNMKDKYICVYPIVMKLHKNDHWDV